MWTIYYCRTRVHSTSALHPGSRTQTSLSTTRVQICTRNVAPCTTKYTCTTALIFVALFRLCSVSFVDFAVALCRFSLSSFVFWLVFWLRLLHVQVVNLIFCFSHTLPVLFVFPSFFCKCWFSLCTQLFFGHLSGYLSVIFMLVRPDITSLSDRSVRNNPSMMFFSIYHVQYFYIFLGTCIFQCLCGHLDSLK